MELGRQASQQADFIHNGGARGYQAAAAASGGGFTEGAMYGAAGGFITVLGAYFILKMFKRNKMSDDFERAD